MRFILILIIFALILFPLQTFDKANNTVIELITSPGYVLFDLSNIKPGDSVTRELVITNNRTEDIKYITSCNFLTGSELFYRKLDLIIEDKSKTLYDGKLSKFNKLELGLLESKQYEKLTFYIKIPIDLGNEYQGLKTGFQFKFYIEGTLGGILPADGPKLPETGSNMFNYLVAGTVLVITGLLIQYFIIKRKKSDSIV
jgi:LPXTG-motif cell wall-anchored protein